LTSCYLLIFVEKLFGVCVIKTISYTVLALFAFAANSLLCRLALLDNHIDAMSFTQIRLFSGAIMLAILVLFPHLSSSNDRPKYKAINKLLPSFFQQKRVFGGIALLVYALSFSFAYIQLTTGTGALILFASVQFTLLGLAFTKGDRFNRPELFGLLIAFIGFVALLSPTLSTPDLFNAVLMILSGIAWGVYTLLGTNRQQAIVVNFIHFVWASLIIIGLSVFIHRTNINISAIGVVYAVLSGAVTSAIGYSLWYAAIPALSRKQAALLQLTVPIWATLAGILWVNEALTLGFILSSLFILLGIGLVIFQRQ
jgi:drug/metabolite transporter (DMT)-like permease